MSLKLSYYHRCAQRKKKKTTTNTEYKTGVVLSRLSNMKKIQIVGQHLQLCSHPGFPYFSLHLDLTMHIFLVPYLERNEYFNSHGFLLQNELNTCMTRQ